jgi:hypothetical protein
VKLISSVFPTVAWTLRRKIFSILLCLLLVSFASIAWELFTPDYFECHRLPQPFTAQQSPKQAAFIARVVATGTLWPRTATPLGEGYPRRYWALALVEKSYWGLPWWDHKIVLLTLFVRGGSGFERGETYFVDGNHWSRRLTQFLPTFETHCTRTNALKYSEVDLRGLRDGAPKNSVRIMGYTFYRMPTGGWKRVPGARVDISGPAGETIVTSDQQGLYDVSGLPPGGYIVNGMDSKGEPDRAYPICVWDGSQSLKSGDIRDCGVGVHRDVID